MSGVEPGRGCAAHGAEAGLRGGWGEDRVGAGCLWCAEVEGGGEVELGAAGGWLVEGPLVQGW